MKPIDLLLSRKSHPRLIEPAPTEEQLEIMFKAALRAPDHANLRPWRYRVFSGESQSKLGELFVEATKITAPDTPEENLQRLAKKPLRAPMVIVASVKIQEHPKVPEVEQILSTGASVQNLLMTAHFLGIGAMWRTGGLTFDPNFMKLLELEENEKLVGFIYLGQEEGNKREPAPFDINDFVLKC
jgi:nitroreductase